MCVWVFVASVAAICVMTGSTIFFFSHYLVNGIGGGGGEFIEYKICVMIFSINFV